MTTTLDPTHIPYQPVDPMTYRPGIGLIGCGGISGRHLAAYQTAGYNVVALCDVDPDRVEQRRAEFAPRAAVLTDHRALLARDDVQVVDIATHVGVRPALVEDALRAGKHVLSQKPFVDDLDVGERLCDLADEVGRVLAVNQNARWSPHFAYALSAVRTGLVGRVHALDFGVYWPHDDWVRGHPVFSVMEDLILWDFGIHWFDMVATLLAAQDRAATCVFTTVGTKPGQGIPVPTQAQCVIDAEEAQATVAFRGSSALGERGSYRIVGTDGMVEHAGKALGGPTVYAVSADRTVEVSLRGAWYNDGLHGTMAELLCAIEEGRRPSNDARASLPGLALCFAAVESARTGRPCRPGDVRRLS